MLAILLTVSLTMKTTMQQSKLGIGEKLLAMMRELSGHSKAKKRGTAVKVAPIARHSCSILYHLKDKFYGSGIMSGAVVLKELFESELFGNNLE